MKKLDRGIKVALDRAIAKVTYELDGRSPSGAPVSMRIVEENEIPHLEIRNGTGELLYQSRIRSYEFNPDRGVTIETVYNPDDGGDASITIPIERFDGIYTKSRIDKNLSIPPKKPPVEKDTDGEWL